MSIESPPSITLYLGCPTRFASTVIDKIFNRYHEVKRPQNDSQQLKTPSLQDDGALADGQPAPVVGPPVDGADVGRLEVVVGVEDARQAALEPRVVLTLHVDLIAAELLQEGRLETVAL